MKSHSELKSDGAVASSSIWTTYCETIEEMAAGICYPKDIDPNIMGQIIIGGDAVEATATFLAVDEDRVKKVVSDMLDPVWSEVYEKLIFPLERAYADIDEDEDEEAKDDYNYLMYDPFTELFKIGRSINPLDRVNSINRAIPPGGTRVELVAWFWTDRSVESEAALHDTYEDLRVQGEWFQLEQSDVNYFKSITCYNSGEFWTMDSAEE